MPTATVYCREQRVIEIEHSLLSSSCQSSFFIPPRIAVKDLICVLCFLDAIVMGFFLRLAHQRRVKERLQITPTIFLPSHNSLLLCRLNNETTDEFGNISSSRQISRDKFAVNRPRIETEFAMDLSNLFGNPPYFYILPLLICAFFRNQRSDRLIRQIMSGQQNDALREKSQGEVSHIPDRPC